MGEAGNSVEHMEFAGLDHYTGGAAERPRMLREIGRDLGTPLK